MVSDLMAGLGVSTVPGAFAWQAGDLGLFVGAVSSFPVVFMIFDYAFLLIIISIIIIIIIVYCTCEYVISKYETVEHCVELCYV